MRGPEFGPGLGDARPRLIHSRVSDPEAAVVMFHGGMVDSTMSMPTHDPAVQVLRPLAHRLERWTRCRLDVTAGAVNDRSAEMGGVP